MAHSEGAPGPVHQAGGTDVEPGPDGLTLWFAMPPRVAGGAGVRLPVTLTPYSAKRLARALAAHLDGLPPHSRK